jgi:hypothetical protein
LQLLSKLLSKCSVYLKKAVQTFAIPLVSRLLFVLSNSTGGGQMQMRSISIFAVGSAAIAPLAGFLRYLLKRPIKVASTSEELLDLFEDRCVLLEGDTTLTSPNDQGRASEHFTLAASSDLVSRIVPVYRIEPGRGLHKKLL